LHMMLYLIHSSILFLNLPSLFAIVDSSLQ
jgi:hypothetical protein